MQFNVSVIDEPNVFHVVTRWEVLIKFKDTIQSLLCFNNEQALFSAFYPSPFKRWSLF